LLHVAELQGKAAEGTSLGSGVMRGELCFNYDEEMHPVSAKCSRCGQLFEPPSSTLRDAVEITRLLSQEFIEHKRLNHPRPFDPESMDDLFTLLWTKQRSPLKPT
jgi:hypothetical protein